MRSPRTDIPLPDITARSWAMVGLLGFVWGATFMGVEIALEGFSAFWVAAGRLVFGAALLLPVWVSRGARMGPPTPGRARWPHILAVGLTGSMMPFFLLSWGQQYVTSGFAGVTMAAVPLMVIPLAHLLFPGERMSWHRVLGFGIGFAGVWVLIGQGAMASTGVAGEAAGRLACLGAAACYAASSILVRRCPPIDPLALATLLICTGAGIALPLTLALEGWPPPPPPHALAALVVIGMISTASANLLRVLVIRSAGPVFMNLTNYQVPLWSVLLGWLVLDEPLPPALLTAMVLILGGMAFSQQDALRRLFGAASR
ncbi:MAG: DMT family transporter [Paracoccaceae bacterium]